MICLRVLECVFNTTLYHFPKLKTNFDVYARSFSYLEKYTYMKYLILRGTGKMKLSILISATCSVIVCSVFIKCTQLIP